MTTIVPVAVNPLRQCLIDEMDIRRFGRETQRNYIRDVGRFATFLGRSPDTATAEEVLLDLYFQLPDPAAFTNERERMAYFSVVKYASREDVIVHDM